MSKLSELKVLQAMRLKGRVDEATVVATVDEDPATAAATIADLIEPTAARAWKNCSHGSAPASAPPR